MRQRHPTWPDLGRGGLPKAIEPKPANFADRTSERCRLVLLPLVSESKAHWCRQHFTAKVEQLYKQQVADRQQQR